MGLDMVDPSPSLCIETGVAGWAVILVHGRYDLVFAFELL
jgi:hypothetical protein